MATDHKLFTRLSLLMWPPVPAWTLLRSLQVIARSSWKVSSSWAFPILAFMVPISLQRKPINHLIQQAVAQSSATSNCYLPKSKKGVPEPREGATFGRNFFGGWVELCIPPSKTFCTNQNSTKVLLANRSNDHNVISQLYVGMLLSFHLSCTFIIEVQG